MNGDDLTVLTLTGDREGPLRLCGRYMARQTLKPRHWLVVDDGVVPVNPESVPGATIIRREPAQACVGIKGMDGRQGMTWGWRGDSRHFTPDRDLTYLRQLIGEDAEAYAEYYEAQQARKIPLL